MSKFVAAVQQQQERFREIGRRDYLAGKPMEQNPFRFGGGANKHAKASGWEAGWIEASKAVDSGNGSR